jgi:hypothetical protein
MMVVKREERKRMKSAEEEKAKGGTQDGRETLCPDPVLIHGDTISIGRSGCAE